MVTANKETVGGLEGFSCSNVTGDANTQILLELLLSDMCNVTYTNSLSSLSSPSQTMRQYDVLLTSARTIYRDTIQVKSLV